MNACILRECILEVYTQEVSSASSNPVALVSGSFCICARHCVSCVRDARADGTFDASGRSSSGAGGDEWDAAGSHGRGCHDPCAHQPGGGGCGGHRLEEEPGAWVAEVGFYPDGRWTSCRWSGTSRSTAPRPRRTQIEPAPKLPAGLFTNKSAAPANGPVNVLLLDYLNTPVTAQANARKQLIEFLDKAPAGTRIAIFGMTTHLYMLQGFTSDMAVLKAALTSKKGTPQVSDILTDAVNSGPMGTTAFSDAAASVSRCDAGDARRYGASRCSDYLGGAERPDAVHSELVRPTGAVPGGHSRAEERDLVLRQLSSGRRAQCQRGRSERLGGPQRRSGAQDGQPADARAGCGVSSGLRAGCRPIRTSA